MGLYTHCDRFVNFGIYREPLDPKQYHSLIFDQYRSISSTQITLFRSLQIKMAFKVRKNSLCSILFGNVGATDIQAL